MVVQYHSTIFPENLESGTRKKEFLNDQWREHERERGEQHDEHME
jgi:hypothetical protein